MTLRSIWYYEYKLYPIFPFSFPSLRILRWCVALPCLPMQGWFSCKLEQKRRKPCKSSLSLNLPIVLSLQEAYRLEKKMAGGNAAGSITWFWNEVRISEISVTAASAGFDLKWKKSRRRGLCFKWDQDKGTSCSGPHYMSGKEDPRMPGQQSQLFCSSPCSVTHQATGGTILYSWATVCLEKSPFLGL